MLKPEEQICAGLNETARIIHQNNVENGFWDKKRNIGEVLMLIVGEVAEAMEAHQTGNEADWDAFELFEKEFNYEEDFKRNFAVNIKNSFPDELSDAIIRLLDLSAGLGIDIEKHINYKVKYNKTRPRLHGKNY